MTTLESEDFDHPKSQTSEAVGIDEDVSPAGKIEKVCWRFAESTVVETRRPSIKGAVEIEVMPSVSKLGNACRPENKGTRISIPVNESHFVGKKGPYLFFDSADSFGQSLGFSVFFLEQSINRSSLNVRKIFEGQRVISKDFKIKSQGSNVEIDFWHIWPNQLSGECLKKLKNDEGCWTQFLKNQGLTDEKTMVTKCSNENLKSEAISFQVGIPAKLFLTIEGTSSLSILNEKALCLEAP